MNIRTMVGALTMAVSFLSAQEVTPAIGAHSKALLFGFSGLNNLGAGSYAGGIGAKFFLSPAMALRGGLSFANNSTTLAANPPAGQTGIDGSNWSLAYGLNAGIEYHLAINRVSPYVGGMASITSTSTEQKNTVNNTGGVQTTTKNNGGAGMRFGGGGIMGVEFFLTKEISLGAEYTLGFFLNSFSDTEVSAGGVTVTTKNGSASNFSVSNGGALTLSVYF